MQTQNSLLVELAGFTGTQTLYRHWTKRINYTDGIHYLAEEAESYWLIDAVASWQLDKKICNNQMLQEFQIWILKVDIEKTSAVLTCYEDTDKPILKQEIEFTDFPLEEIKLYVVEGTLMLPTEY
jgi:hypothetical protein